VECGFAGDKPNFSTGAVSGYDETVFVLGWAVVVGAGDCTLEGAFAGNEPNFSAGAVVGFGGVALG
jgi:hypothetical protein